MDTPDAGDGRFSLGRRRVLKALGGSAVAVGALSGTASASSSQFYGCSQVCTDTDANHAVVLVDDHYECRILDRYEGGTDRNNVPWGYRSGCYEIGDHEDAVVGVLHDCKLCLNPNTCAGNFVDAVDDVVADVEACGLACEEIAVGDSCRVYHSNGWPAWTDGKRPGKSDHGNGMADSGSDDHDGDVEDAGPPHDGRRGDSRTQERDDKPTGTGDGGGPAQDNGNRGEKHRGGGTNAENGEEKRGNGKRGASGKGNNGKGNNGNGNNGKGKKEGRGRKK